MSEQIPDGHYLGHIVIDDDDLDIQPEFTDDDFFDMRAELRQELEEDRSYGID
jgi:hypothetical protein